MGWVEPVSLVWDPGSKDISYGWSQCLWKQVMGGASVYSVGASVYGVGASVYGVGASVYGNHVILVSPQSQFDLDLDLGLLRV